MAINYSLKIGSIKRRLVAGSFSDVITEVRFRAEAQSEPVTTGSEEEDGDFMEVTPSFTYTCSGVTTFPVEEIDGSTFIDFSAIDKDTITAWLLASEGVSSLENFSYVKNSIENVAKQLYDYSLEVSDTISGADQAGSSSFTYSPTPTEEE